MSKYYCKKCKKYHYRGKIYEDHLDYKREKKSKGKNPDCNNIKVNFETLRPIAKRQLRRLYKKMKSAENHEFFKKEIIKLIKNEKRK